MTKKQPQDRMRQGAWNVLGALTGVARALVDMRPEREQLHTTFAVEEPASPAALVAIREAMTVEYLRQLVDAHVLDDHEKTRDLVWRMAELYGVDTDTDEDT